MAEKTRLALCQQGHTLVWLADGDKGREIHYWVAVARHPRETADGVDDGHFNYAPHEGIEPLATARAGRREVMCPNGHGRRDLHGDWGKGELDFADLFPVINGERSKLIIQV